MENWSVYILRNERNALYTGATNDVPRRIRQHTGKLAKGARFTRACHDLKLVYHCEIGPRSLALRVEARIKKLAKPRKEALVAASPQAGRLLEMLELTH